MRTFTLYNIAAIILILFTIIMYFYFTHEINTLEADQAENTETKIKLLENKTKSKIDSLKIQIQESKVLRKNDSVRYAKSIYNLHLKQNQILNNFKIKQDEILNSSDSSDWDWFNRRFPKLHNNTRAIKSN